MAGNKVQTAAVAAEKHSENRTLLGGLFVRRKAWRLSWWGCLLILFSVTIVAGVVFRNLDFLLSVNAPTNSDILVVEGWIPPAPLRSAADMIKTGHYRMIITSGCFASDEWGISTNDTYAELAALRLRQAGVNPALIQPVPSRVERKDRTYHSALAVREWFEAHNMYPPSIDVLTVGPHARRSRLLYEKAFGDGTKIGIIPFRDPKYDSARWWVSSEGVREVMSEAMAYVYARFFFRVSDQV